MSYEMAELVVKILKRDKEAIRRLAQAEGEPMSVVVRRILKKELAKHEELYQQEE